MKNSNQKAPELSAAAGKFTGKSVGVRKTKIPGFDQAVGKRAKSTKND
jgi:hypothetical protein